MTMKNGTMKKKLGFTLIELMITVGIISILSGLLFTVLNPQGLRSKTRDKQRYADLKRIQSALELYYADYRTYPLAGTGWSRLNQQDFIDALSPYIDPIPFDPLYDETIANQGPYASPDLKRYNYHCQDGSDYILTAMMEVELDPGDPNVCNNLDYWTDVLNRSGGVDDYGTEYYCYGVTSP